MHHLETIAFQHLVERIFQFGESCDGADPTWGLSDRMGLKAAKSALAEVIYSLVPEGVRKSARQARHFVATNIL